jgi:hypothetical protein
VVTVDAIDPDGDALFYRYEAQSGTVIADPSQPGQATYQNTGGTAGADTLTVTVTDSRNTSASLARSVSLQGNRSPQATLSSVIDACHPPCRVTYTVQATDPDGDALQYAWSGCTSGTGTSSPCQVTNLGPVVSSVTVSDGQGGVTVVSATAQGTNQVPTIQIAVDAPQGVTRLIPSETDADGDRMFCGWFGNCRCTGNEQSFLLFCELPSFGSSCFQEFRCADTWGGWGRREAVLRR